MNKNLIAGLAVLILLAAGAGILVANSGDDNSSVDGMNVTQEVATQSNQAEKAASESANSDPVTSTAVEIKDYAFAPATIKVKVGDTVTWTNQDSVKHDITADDASEDAPKSQLLAKGESYSFTFTKAGTYSYFCTPHPYMKGKVIVE